MTNFDPQEPLQLSATLTITQYAGRTVEEVIERNPLLMQSLLESGQVKLAPGAMRYLREELVDWHEVAAIWDDSKKAEK